MPTERREDEEGGGGHLVLRDDDDAPIPAGPAPPAPGPSHCDSADDDGGAVARQAGGGGGKGGGGTSPAAVTSLAPSPPSPSPPPPPPLPFQPPPPPPVRFTVTPRFLARVAAAAWTGLEEDEDNHDDGQAEAEEPADDARRALLLARLLPALLPAKLLWRRRREEQQQRQQQHHHQQQQHRQRQRQAPSPSSPLAGEEEEEDDGGGKGNGGPSLAAPPAPTAAAAALATPTVILRVDPSSANAVPDRSALAYTRAIFRLALFYWSLVSDACLVGALFAAPAPAAAAPVPLLALACALAILPHAVTALLLVARQGWLGAAWQAALFVLSLNPLRGIVARSRSRGAAGALLVAGACLAYALVAASGLLFVSYVLATYMATALLFALLVLDLAALVLAATPQESCFKYGDLVYGEAYRTTRLAVHALLQSLPSLLTVVAFLAYAGGSLPGRPVLPAAWWARLWGCGGGEDASGVDDDALAAAFVTAAGGHGGLRRSGGGADPEGLAVVVGGRHHHGGGDACRAPPVPSFPLADAVGVPAAVVAQAAAAHLANVVDKWCMLRASADAAGCAPGWRGLADHWRSVLAVRAASYVARPVIADNVERMPRERPEPPPLVALAEAEEGREARGEPGREEPQPPPQQQQQEAQRPREMGAADDARPAVEAATDRDEDEAGEDEDDGDAEDDGDEEDPESGGLLSAERPPVPSGGDDDDDVEAPAHPILSAAQQRRQSTSRRSAREAARLVRRCRQRLPGPSALLLSAGDEADCAERRAAEREAAGAEDVASVVPEWVFPPDGARLCAGQLVAVASAGFARYAGPGVRDLALDLTRDTRPGRLVTMAAVAFPRLSCVRLARARLVGAPDARAFSSALLALPSLAALQMHACELDARGVDALAAVLQRAPRLVAVELCGSDLPLRGPAGVEAGTSLARGVRGALRLRDLSLAGTRLHPEAFEAIARAIAAAGGGRASGQQQPQQRRGGLVAANLSYCDGGGGALTALLRSPLQLLAVGLDELGERGGQALVRAVLDAASLSCSSSSSSSPLPPPQHAVGPSSAPCRSRPSIVFRWSLGVAPVTGLVAPPPGGPGQNGENGGDGDGGNGDPIRVVVVGNRESVTYGDAWSALVADAASERRGFAPASQASPPPPPPAPILALVLTQDEAATWRLRLPRLFVPTHGGMDTLDLSGLGIGDAGAAAAAREISADVPVRQLVLADNAIGVDGARMLAGAIDGDLGGGGGGDDSGCGRRDDGQQQQQQQEEEEEEEDEEQRQRAAGGWWRWWWSSWGRRRHHRPRRGRASPSAFGAPLLEKGGGSDDLEAPTPPPARLAAQPPLARLEVLDLSCNDLDDDAALALASAIDGLGRGSSWSAPAVAASSAAAAPHVALAIDEPPPPPPLRIVLAGNKLPFAPETLRALVTASRSNRRRVRLQLDEAPELTVERLERSGDAEGAARARAFFSQQAARRAARRQRRAERSSSSISPAAAAAPLSPPGAGPSSVPASFPLPPADADPPDDAAAAAAAGAARAPSTNGSDEDGTCKICFDASLADGGGVALRFCGHFLCVGCFRRVWQAALVRPSGSIQAPTCPFCRSVLMGYNYLADDDGHEAEEEGERLLC